MQVPYDEKLQARVIETYEASLAAINAHDEAKTAFDKSAARSLVAAGLGRGAEIRHIHAHAHYGKESQAKVVSRICNGGADQRGRAYVRVELGSVKGGLTTCYATLYVEHIIEVVKQSATPYFAMEV